ncbi:MAG: energy transducer TonB [Holophaga sp.]|nr:energy transducer TonB [Holophaga sp.]
MIRDLGNKVAPCQDFYPVSGPPPEPDFSREITAIRPHLSMFISLCLCLIVAWILSLWRVFAPGSNEAQAHCIAIVELAALKPPAYDPEIGHLSGPAGGSNRDGTESIDPALRNLKSVKVIIQPPASLAQVSLLEPTPTALTFDQVWAPLPRPLVLDKSLPVHLGGNGAPKGNGKGFGRGDGDSVGNGSGFGGPNRQAITNTLKLKSSVQPTWRIGRDSMAENGDAVRVKVTIDGKGVPVLVIPISGRKALFPCVVQAAQKWRFIVPPGFETLAPFDVTIDFKYWLGEKPSCDVKEVQAVTLSRPTTS